jgi:hypothetical protein
LYQFRLLLEGKTKKKIVDSFFLSRIWPTTSTGEEELVDFLLYTIAGILPVIGD